MTSDKPKKLTVLDQARLRAEDFGYAEPICKVCTLFDPPADPESDYGTCFWRSGKLQFKFGVCGSWTALPFAREKLGGSSG